MAAIDYDKDFYGWLSSQIDEDPVPVDKFLIARGAWNTAIKLVEEKFNSPAQGGPTNNARDEIAAIIAEYSSHKYLGCESCVRIIKRLRQLSPVA